jgi:hypothetical protein
MAEDKKDNVIKFPRKQELALNTGNKKSQD